MLANNSQGIEHALSRNDDVDLHESFHCDEDDDVAFELGTSPNRILKLSIWAVSSATAIYTTKILLVNYGYHYPLALAFRYFVILFIVYTWVALLDFSSTNDVNARRNISWPSLAHLVAAYFLPKTHWMVMLPSSLAASASIPMLLEGLLHMPSLPVLAMIFPLVYATESLTLYLCRTSYRNGKGIPWGVVVVITASVVILYFENRLMVPGLIWGITGVLMLGFSRAFFVLGSEPAGADRAIQDAYRGFCTMTLVSGMVLSSTSSYFLEKLESTWPLSYTTLALMFLNMATVIGISFSGTSIVAYSAFSFGSATSTSSRNLGLVGFVSFNLLLLLAAMFLPPMSYVSGIQIAAFLTASTFLIGFDQIHNFVTDRTNNYSRLRKDATDDWRVQSKYITVSILALAIMVVSLILSFTSSALINFPPVSPATTYDRSYHPQSRFDIVISMYQEDSASVQNLIHQLKSTALLQHLSSESYQTRIIVYTKDPSADLEALKQDTGADIIERLENTGREGGTYLTHIVNKWNSLAEQTMFVQAHAHNMRELIPRINDYLVMDTGMLSLGFTGKTCACGTCGDRWGWEDQQGVVPAIYKEVYSEPCRPSQSILLSYKGQFVASARRIRGVRREVYMKLLEAITSEGGWRHRDTSTEHYNIGGTTGEESPSNPFFGFTMERLWSLVMQCAVDQRVAIKCPSLLSGKGVGGLVQDCQCLDNLS